MRNTITITDYKHFFSLVRKSEEKKDENLTFWVISFINMNMKIKTTPTQPLLHQFTSIQLHFHRCNCLISLWIDEIQKKSRKYSEWYFSWIKLIIWNSLLLKIIHDELRSQLRLIDMNKDQIVYTYIARMVYVCSIV